MTSPIANQTTSLRSVQPEREIINTLEKRMERIGTRGTIGVLNGRFTWGWLLRITHTPALTRTNASSVPTLVISSRTLSGTSVASTDTKKPTTIELRYGVRNRGCTLLAHGQSRPSRDIE